MARSRGTGLALARRRSASPLLSAVALLLTVALLGVGADSATAARPARGALYGDLDSTEPDVVYLKVSASGHSLNPRRSVIDWGDLPEVDPGPCGELVRLHLGSSRHPVRIRRDGTFRFVRRLGRFVFRLHGRFLTKDRAHVGFRYRREPARRGRRRACDDSSAALAPRRIAPLNFHDCRRHKARTLLLAPTGRVFRELRWFPGTELGWTKVAYACLFSTNKLVKLGVDDGDFDTPELTLFRLAGPYVAYVELDPCGLEGCYTLFVRDLRSGTRTKDLDRGVPGVFDLQLKDNGSVAWLSRGPEVWVADGLGVRRLDSGNIDSLALSGSTLTWRKDGVVHSATVY